MGRMYEDEVAGSVDSDSGSYGQLSVVRHNPALRQAQGKLPAPPPRRLARLVPQEAGLAGFHPVTSH